MPSNEGSAASTWSSHFDAKHDRLRGESRLETRIQRLTRNVAVNLGSCLSFAKMIRASSTTPGPSTISTQSWVEDFETLASNSGKGASVYKECLAECRQPDGSVLYTEALCTVEDQLRLQIKSLSGISTAISELVSSSAFYVGNGRPGGRRGNAAFATSQRSKS